MVVVVGSTVVVVVVMVVVVVVVSISRPLIGGQSVMSCDVASHHTT